MLYPDRFASSSRRSAEVISRATGMQAAARYVGGSPQRVCRTGHHLRGRHEGAGARPRAREGPLRPVDSTTQETRFPGVYAIGDVATPGTPKAGVFAEGTARALAATRGAS